MLCSWIERLGSMHERSLLQLSVGVAGIVPVAAGIAGILLGPEFVDAVVGAGADSHLRYLSGLLLGIGLGFWSTIPRIEADGERFRLLSFIVVAGGVARLISLVVIGLPPFGMPGRPGNGARRDAAALPMAMAS